MDYFATDTRTKYTMSRPDEKYKGEKELIDSNKKFLALIAHDIKTPMGSVVGFLTMIKDNLQILEREKVEEYIKIVLNSAERTYALLNNLLEWANAENIYTSYKPEIINFYKLMEEEIANTEMYTSQKQIKINLLTLPDEQVFADKKMVKCILRNLLVNAIKYSHKSGRIDITSRRADNFLEISITDYGVGIDAKTAGSIFSTKNYISTLGTDNEPGTGYGLLLCKELVEINEGSIWVVGKADKGSKFNFTLPLVP